MSRIHLMKPELSNLIAAGEVIERPASVIKELAENSIDAQAKNIYIGVTDAGKGTIMVKDDGIGMDREDAQNCFLRHASSKIRTEYDLARIRTLGFRGEALPSIASVSKITLTTATDDSEGTQVISIPNEELKINSAPCRKGTIFEVSNLFFNTPARLKYLKSNQSETYSIIETVEHLALGFPSVSICLAIDGKEIFKTSGRGDLLETIQKIYGNTIAQAVYPIEKDDYAFGYKGFVSKPEVSYSKRYNMLTFLNNRYIYDFRINKAIEDAYRDYLPPLRYPFTVICLEIDPSLVDVNVHPTKKEVRISCEDEIARSVREAILITLKNKKPIYEAGEDAKTTKDLNITEENPFDIADIKEEEKTVIENTIDPLLNKDETIFLQDSLPFEPTYEVQSVNHFPKPATPTPVVNEILKDINIKPTDAVTSAKEENKVDYESVFAKESYSNKLPEMHPLGQILHTYIICDSTDCFYLIDQHAAAERVNFEKTEALFSQVRSRIVPLFPITLELSFKEKQNYDDEHITRLLSLGIVTEIFGDKTIKVTEIPSFLSTLDDEAIIRDMVSSCLNDEKTDAVGLLHLTIANIACKKSIKANHQMSLSEIEGLLSDLAKCKNPANCPHGRPTLIKVSRSDIEKIFRRSGF
ncbi:MAG: DNA mismatch repair endonuclease MutL [Bacilli bacterium]